ncbi:hypothetical protein OBBRIDRAFT_789352 [Obba rivulosa]|uniref:MYND-type domain-containing protein n=1 Tax=Obba rivulosa TaxID=1052685 RepID=A0A8E2J4G7_9APHY|nr:hypothetical protein OBBRIDRAFT_789352 [Obba rivulosa]
MPPTKKPVSPCLPPELLKTLKKDADVHLSESRIFQPNFERYRLRVLSARCSPDATQTSTPPTPDKHNNVKIVHDMMKTDPKDGKTMLHLAGIKVDLPQAYESIRLGAGVNFRDNGGETPLFTACKWLFIMFRFRFDDIPHLGQLSRPPIRLTSNPFPQGSLRCAASIVSLLVTQHADVNVTVEGHTPLSLICLTGYWPLIKLLVEHGATLGNEKSSGLSSLFATAGDKARFLRLVRVNTPPKPRPPRPCPCWSGKLLSECHEVGPQSYPENFPCVCGNPKSFMSCCRKKGVQCFDGWSKEQDRIVINYVLSPAPEKILGSTRTSTAVLVELRAYMENLRRNKSAMVPIINKKMLEWAEWYKMAIAKKLMTQGSADPAFVSILSKPKVVYPSNKIRRLPYAPVALVAMNWNTAVDEYIASGIDKRSRLDIKKETMLNSNGGALIVRCEAEGCSEVESKTRRLLRCHACQMVLYCSHKCQKSDWNRHKPSCRGATAFKEDLNRSNSTPQRYLQLLPSQKAFERKVHEVYEESLRLVGDMKSIDEAFKGSMKEVSGVYMDIDMSNMLLDAESIKAAWSFARDMVGQGVTGVR